MDLGRSAVRGPREPAGQLTSSDSSEALDAAQELALHGFPEEVQVAARARLKALLDGKGMPFASPARKTCAPRPSLIPALPISRPSVDIPSYPEGALDDPDVRDEWEKAHRDAAEARFQLLPVVLRTHAENQLAIERWDARQRGRKPSGDLRHPVRRDRLEKILMEMSARHYGAISRSLRTIEAIASGDVIGVEVHDTLSPPLKNDRRSRKEQRKKMNYGGYRFVTLVLRSELDREAARLVRTPEQIAIRAAEWEQVVQEMLANLPPDEPEQEIPNLPDLPVDRLPTRGEVRAFSQAVKRHLDYVDRGKRIQAKADRDAQIKVRTQATREAAQADPEASEAMRQATKLKKAADRQRRLRERRKAAKDTSQ